MKKREKENTTIFSIFYSLKKLKVVQFFKSKSTHSITRYINMKDVVIINKGK